MADATGLRRPLPGRHRAVQRVGAQRRVPRRAAALGGRRRDVHRRHRRRSSTASSGCSTAATRCWPTPARSAATRPSPRRWPTTPAGLARAVVGGGVARTSTCPPTDVAAYRDALLERFANPRMHHRLDQIAADGSQKLPIRILPVLRAERAAGRMPAGRHPRARRLDRATCAGSAHRSTMRAPTTVVPLAGGPAARRGAARARLPRPGARRRRRRRRRPCSPQRRASSSASAT